MKKQNEDTLRSIRYAIGSSDLPTLTGSTQEIELAKTIRVEILMEANDIIAGLHHGVSANSNANLPLEEAILASQRLRDTLPAEWWIAQRNVDVNALLKGLTHRSYAMESGRN